VGCIRACSCVHFLLLVRVQYYHHRHCYYIGLEANQNSILHNIGSKTNDLITWGEQLAGQSDNDRATFFIRSSVNDFIGNVAAGSAGRG
jgi:hypothetical protein